MADYLERGTVFPSAAAQALYPLDTFPCERCEHEGLPHLVDNSAEYYWEHQHKSPGSSARSGCPRFGVSHWCGAAPRRHSAPAPRYLRTPYKVDRMREQADPTVAEEPRDDG